MIGKILLVGMTVLGTAYVFTPTAEAADGGGGCGGRLVDYIPFNVDGQKVGQLQFYYNAQNGNNCAIMLHGGPTWGVARDTGVGLYKRRPGAKYHQQAAFERKSSFKYQAGPIRTAGDGWCVMAGGGITHKGRHLTLYTRDHCG